MESKQIWTIVAVATIVEIIAFEIYSILSTIEISGMILNKSGVLDV